MMRVGLLTRRAKTLNTYLVSGFINKVMFQSKIPEGKNLKRILVVKPDNIGDVVLSSLLMPALCATGAHDFGASIVYIVKKGLKDLLFPVGCISDTIEIPWGRGHLSEAGGECPDCERPEKKAAWAILKRCIKDYKPEAIIDLRASPPGNIAAFWAGLSGTPYRVALDGFRLREIFGRKAERKAKWERHEAETFFLAMKQAGLFPEYADYRSALRFWSLPGMHSPHAGPYVLLQPGAVWEHKRWPYFTELINSVAKRYEGLRFVLVGAAGEGEVCERVFLGLDEDARSRTENLAGKTSLRELIPLVNGAELVVANDSGVAHIAGALGRQTVVFFGPSSPARFTPLSACPLRVKVFHFKMECCPCDQMDCRYGPEGNCLSRIPPEAVLAYINGVFRTEPVCASNAR